MRINIDFKIIKRKLDAALRCADEGISLSGLNCIKIIPQQTISYYLRQRRGVVKIGQARNTKYKLIDKTLFDKTNLNIINNTNGFKVAHTVKMPKLEKFAWDFLAAENPSLKFPSTKFENNLIQSHDGKIKDVISAEIKNGDIDGLERSLCPFISGEKLALEKKLEMFNVITASQFSGVMHFWIDTNLRLHCVPLAFSLVPNLNAPFIYTVGIANRALARKFWKRNWHACQLGNIENSLYQISDIF